jgi:hypothetical protein
MIFELLIASWLYLYIILIGFLAANTELCGTTRQVPMFYLTILFLCQFQEN